jgi:hypothetical protein
LVLPEFEFRAPLARQGLYHLSHTPALFAFIVFGLG